MNTSEILVIIGAFFSAVAAFTVFSLDQFRDQDGAQEKIARKQGDIPNASEKAEKRIKLERFLFAGLPLLLAVAANVAALVVE